MERVAPPDEVISIKLRDKHYIDSFSTEAALQSTWFNSIESNVIIDNNYLYVDLKKPKEKRITSNKDLSL